MRTRSASVRRSTTRRPMSSLETPTQGLGGRAMELAVTPAWDDATEEPSLVMASRPIEVEERKLSRSPT
jgi:hypothetical protein